MAIGYTELDFTDGAAPALNAANMNHIDEGVKACADQLDAQGTLTAGGRTDANAIAAATGATLSARIVGIITTGLSAIFAALAHASRHQHGGADEIATATPAPNAIPKADGSGKLDGWVSSVVTPAGKTIADGLGATPPTKNSDDIYPGLRVVRTPRSLTCDDQAALVLDFDNQAPLDRSGNTRVLTPEGAPTYVAGKVGYALSINANTDYLNAGSLSPITIGDQISLNWWQYIATGATGGGFFSTVTAYGATALSLRIRRSNDDLLVEGGTGTSGVVKTMVNFFTGFYDAWMNIGITIDYTNGTYAVYRNGVLVVSAANTMVKPTTGIRWIGSYSATTGQVGLMDEIHIVNRLMTLADMVALYNVNGTALKPATALALVSAAMGSSLAGAPNRTSTATPWYVGIIDVASGASGTLPSGGTFLYEVQTYGATYNSVMAAIVAGGAMSGTASANLRIRYQRLTA